MNRTLAIAAVLTFCGSVTPSMALDKRYPDWPCKQLKVPVLRLQPCVPRRRLIRSEMPGKKAPGLPDLVTRLAARRTPMAEVEKEIANYLTGTAEEKREKAKLLFAGLLDTLNSQRTQVMNGLERAYRKQKQVAETLRDEIDKLRKLQDTSNTDQAQIEELGRRVEWETRIFEDRRKTTSFACEVPIEIEQRLFALSRAIQGALG